MKRMQQKALHPHLGLYQQRPVRLHVLIRPGMVRQPHDLAQSDRNGVLRRDGVRYNVAEFYIGSCPFAAAA